MTDSRRVDSQVVEAVDKINQGEVKELKSVLTGVLTAPDQKQFMDMMASCKDAPEMKLPQCDVQYKDGEVDSISFGGNDFKYPMTISHTSGGDLTAKDDASLWQKTKNVFGAISDANDKATSGAADGMRNGAKENSDAYKNTNTECSIENQRKRREEKESGVEPAVVDCNK